MKDTKKARIVRALKELVLRSSRGVSRQEAADALRIDLRTAAAHLERLTSAGLFRSETAPAEGKGRPGLIYRSNTGMLAFLGLSLSQTLTLSAMAVDASGNVLREEVRQLSGEGSRLAVFTAIRDCAAAFRTVGGKRLYGIGLAISRWLQPPLAGDDTYANLSDYLEREIGVAVYRDVNINAVAKACSVKLREPDLAVIHTGLVIEFGLVRGGEPQLDFARRETWLSHLCVNPKGRQCYCGKYGCLENYVTRGALNERLKSPAAAAVKQSLGAMLASALRRLARKYQVGSLMLVGADEIFPEVERALRHDGGEPAPTLRRTAFRLNVSYGAALEAAHFELYRFTGPGNVKFSAKP